VISETMSYLTQIMAVGPSEEQVLQFREATYHGK